VTEPKPVPQSPEVDPATGAANVADRTTQVAPPAVAASDFRAVYEAHFDYIYHTLRRLGVPDRDLEDLLHEVFIAFYRGDTYDPSRPLKPWLFGIAFRVASDYRRRAQHRYEVPPYKDGWQDLVPDTAPGADEQVAQRQRRDLVQAGLATLDLDKRAVFVMHDIDGHSMPEIAAVLSAPLNTLYSRLRLARGEFAAAIKRYALRHGGGGTP
jgi:RNA polymerase sigma-70 factor, ECF subfamily